MRTWLYDLLLPAVWFLALEPPVLCLATLLYLMLHPDPLRP